MLHLMTLIFPTNQRKCASSLKNVAILLVVQMGHHRAQQIDRQSALQTSQKERNDRIPFTFTFHPHNHTVKSIVLKNFKLLQNDPETRSCKWHLRVMLDCVKYCITRNHIENDVITTPQGREIALNSPISTRICLSKPKILSFELSNFQEF